MTVSSTITTVERAGNGVAREFSFSPIRIFDETQLEVVVRNAAGVLTTISRGTGANAYAVVATFVENESATGSIRYPESGGTLLPAGSFISIRRVIPFTQEMNLENQGGYQPEVQEKAHDLHVMRIQQLEEEVDRAIQVPFGSGIDPDTYYAQVQTAIDSVDIATSAAAAAEAVAVNMGAYDIADVATLLANTTLTYTAGSSNSVWENLIIRARAENLSYRVLASAATDQDVSTAGGVKLRVLYGGSGVDIRAFGAVNDGVTNCDTAFSKASARLLADGGGTLFIRGGGTYLINATISIQDTQPATKVINIVGDYNTIIQKAATMVSVNGGDNQAILLFNLKTPTVVGLTLKGYTTGSAERFGDDGLRVVSCVGTRILYNKFYDFGDSAVRVRIATTDTDESLGELCLTHGNHFDNCTQTSTTSSGTGGARDYIFTNNTFKNLKGSVKFAARQQTGKNRLIVANNILEGFNTAGIGAAGIEIPSWGSVLIHNNHLKDLAGTNIAMNIYANPDGSSPVGFEWDNYIISNNILDNVNTGIRIANGTVGGVSTIVRNIQIKNNTILKSSTNTNWGISMLSGAFEGVSIEGNIIRGSGGGINYAPVCLVANAIQEGCLLNNNDISVTGNAINITNAGTGSDKKITRPIIRGGKYVGESCDFYGIEDLTVDGVYFKLNTPNHRQLDRPSFENCRFEGNYGLSFYDTVTAPRTVNCVFNISGGFAVALRYAASAVTGQIIEWNNNILAGSVSRNSQKPNYIGFGTGVPTLAAVNGSTYRRTDGTGTTDNLYVYRDAATAWVGYA